MNELEAIYEKIGSLQGPPSDELMAELDAILAKVEKKIEIVKEKDPNWGEPLCGSCWCDGKQCWDCAAIRGGCPEDA